MKIIDLQNWKRRDHYEFYKRLAFPYLNITANVNLTGTSTLDQSQRNFTIFSLAYITSTAANRIPELRLRIRGDQVIEHEVIRASFTVLNEDETFGFATIDYAHDFSTFNARILAGIEQSRQNPTIHDEAGRDDMIFLTTLTWVSFTQITHPVPLNPPDSFPRISWGKYFSQSEEILMPLSLMANHALVDGLHVGLFFKSVQEMLDNPQAFLSQ